MTQSSGKNNWLDLANCMRGVIWMQQTKNSILGDISNLGVDLSVREVGTLVQIEIFDSWSGKIITTEISDYGVTRALTDGLLQEMADSIMNSMVTRLFKDVYNEQNPPTPLRPLPSDETIRNFR